MPRAQGSLHTPPCTDEKEVVMHRLTGSAAAIVVWLSLGGLPVAAQTDTVVVTTTQECDTSAVPVACTYTSTDPRVAGTGGHVFVEGISGQEGFVRPGTDIALYWTDYWIEGPEGAWTGHGYLVGDETGTIHALLMLAGEDAYEGWSYVAYGDDPEADADHDLVGVIYQGALPPVGSVPVPADE